MLVRLIAFELRYFSKQTTFRLAAAIFFVLGLLMAVAPMPGGALQNAPIAIALRIGILSLNALFAVVLFAPQSVLRDRESGMEPLIFSTPITHFQYLVSRFVGLCLSAILAFSPAVLGLVFGHLFFADRSNMGTIVAAPYIWAFVVLVIPNLLICCSSLFTAATLTRNSMATYVVGVGLFIAYWLASALGNSPLMAQSSPYAPSDSNPITLLEPFGLIGILEAVRFWTVEQQNDSLIPVQGALLMNRLLWLGMASSLFALTLRFFRFREPLQGTKEIEVNETWATVAYQAVSRHSVGVSRDIRQIGAQVRLGLSGIFRSAPFYLLLLLWVFFCAVTLFDEQRGGFLNHRLYVDTALVLNVLHEPLVKLGALMVLFFTAELFWAERQCRIHELIFTSGLRVWSHFAAKLIVLATLTLALVVGTLALGLGFQTLLGSAGVDLTAVSLFVVQAWIPLTLVAALSLVVLNLVPNKYAGMLVSFLVVMLFTGVIISRVPGFNHPFWRIIWSPSFDYSTFARTSIVGWSFLWPFAYAVSILTVLSAGTIAYWQNRRFGQGHHPLLVGMAFLGVFILTASGLTLRSKVDLRPRMTSKSARYDWLAGHERKWAHRAQDQIPKITTVSLNMDIAPDQRNLLAQGSFELINQHADPIHELLIHIPDSVNLLGIESSLGSIRQVDDSFGYYVILWQSGLQVGQVDQLSFTVEANFSGLRAPNPELYVTPGSSYLEMDKAIPSLGYQNAMVITNKRERSKRGLQALPTRDDCAGLPKTLEDHVFFKARITTDTGQQVLAPGSCLDVSSSGPRTTYVYESRDPISLGLGISCGLYVERSTLYGDVPIRVLTGAHHQENVDTILMSAVDALTYFEANFGPYPHEQLVIAEIPSFSDSFAATAYPGLIYVVEDRALRIDEGTSSSDIFYRLMAHELSHQWWAHQVDPADCHGARMLAETLAEYSQMVVTEKRFGLTSTLAYQKAMDAFYFTWRSYDENPEPPLHQVGSEAYVAYFKGSHAMYLLRDMLGEARVNEILRQLIDEFRYPKKPTASDLLDLIRPHLQADQLSLFETLFQRVAWYDLSISSASTRAETDAWLTLLVMEVQPRGDHIDGPKSYRIQLVADNDEVILERDYVLEAGQHSLDLKTNVRPKRAVIDPTLLKLEADRSDNMVEVVVAPN